ncbi:MAG: YoaK family protein [Microbacterium sp.]|nr:YoaK family protein [Microbacterium sp.]
MAKRYDPADWDYIWALLLLTVATGIGDGVSYLGLDRVFTGNMTGNVLFIGFALAGDTTIPLLNNVLALGGFVVGATVASLIVRGKSHPSRLSDHAMLIILVGALVSLGLGTTWAVLQTLPPVLMLAVTMTLAVVMGAQAAAVKATGIVDVSTIVVTNTLANLAMDSPLAGGAGAKSGRRIGAILCMAIGGFVGAMFVLHLGGGGFGLIAEGVLMLVALLLLQSARRREAARLA